MKLKIETCMCNKSAKLFIKQKWDKQWIEDYSRIDCQCAIFDTVYSNAEQAGDAMGSDYKPMPYQDGISTQEIVLGFTELFQIGKQ